MPSVRPQLRRQQQGTSSSGSSRCRVSWHSTAARRARATLAAASEDAEPQSAPATDDTEIEDEAAEEYAVPPTKFLFDDMPTGNEPEGEARESGDILAANPAFASVFKGALERSRAARDAAPTPQQRQQQPPAQAAGASPQPAADAPSPQELQQQARTLSADPEAEQPEGEISSPAVPPPPPLPSSPPPAAAPPGALSMDDEPTQSASEEVLLSALRDSRRNLVTLEQLYQQVGEAIQREKRQFDRLHFAYQKAQRDSAYMRTLQRMLDDRSRQRQQ